MSLFRSLGGALSALAMVAAGCSATNPEQIGAAEPATPRVEQVLRVAAVGLETIDPAAITPADAELIFAVDLLHDSLTDFDRAGGGVRPGVADRWSTDDGVTWVFEIGSGRTFSDGTPISSEDVVASLANAASFDPASVIGTNLDAIEGVDAFRSGTAEAVSGLATLGPAAVQISTPVANYELPALLANPALAIRPASVVRGDPAAATEAPVGAGPFRLVGSGTGGFSFARISAGEGLDRVEIMRVDTEEEASAALVAGTVDIARHVGGTEAVGGTSLVSVPSGVVHLALNTVDGTTGDADARAALATTIDRSTLATDVVGGPASAVDSLVPGRWWVSGGCHVACSYDTDVAMLAVGDVWPSGAPTVFLDADLSEISTALVSVIEAQMESAGVPVEQRRAEAADLSLQIAAGNHETVLFGSFSPVPSPDPTLWDAFSSTGRSNLSGIPSSGLDEALRAARATPDEDARHDAYREVERLAMSDVAVIPLVSVGALFDISDDISGVDPILGLILDAESVSIDG